MQPFFATFILAVTARIEEGGWEMREGTTKALFAGLMDVVGGNKGLGDLISNPSITTTISLIFFSLVSSSAFFDRKRQNDNLAFHKPIQLREGDKKRKKYCYFLWLFLPFPSLSFHYYFRHTYADITAGRASHIKEHY